MATCRTRPIIAVKPGERVRIVLRNEERGIPTTSRCRACGAALEPLGWNESADVDLRGAGRTRAYEYVCRPHT